MQRRKAVLCILLFSSVAMAGNRWNVTLPGGSMHFQGNVIAEACRVEAGDQQMTVRMGQISSNKVYGVGSDAYPVSFTIHLQDCNTNVSQRIGVGFYGVADDKNPEVLSVESTSNSATGVGIGIFDEQNQLIRLNSPPLIYKSLKSGAMDLKFVAKYRATSRKVTGGIANAQAWFLLTYD